jgi:hypothetical protein
MPGLHLVGDYLFNRDIADDRGLCPEGDFIDKVVVMLHFDKFRQTYFFRHF